MGPKGILSYFKVVEELFQDLLANDLFYTGTKMCVKH